MKIAMLTKSVRKLKLLPPAEAGILPIRRPFKSCSRARLGFSNGTIGETVLNGPNRSSRPRCTSARKLTSCHFVGRSGDVDLNLLYTKVGMDRFQDRLSGIFASANPDCPGPANQRKRIVADQYCRAL